MNGWKPMKIFGMAVAAISFAPTAHAAAPVGFEWVDRFVKYEGNPILRPQGEWAADLLFNPAAIVKDGRVGILCRGVNLRHPVTNGCWSVSNLIWAWSDDGFHFTVDEKPFLAPDATSPYKGGFEDPRLVYVPEEKLYVLTYTGVKGVGPDGRWMTPGLIAWSKDLVTWEFGGETFPDRAVCITPRRIGGKYWAYYDNRSLHTAWSEDLRQWHLTGRCVAPPRPGKFDSELCEAVAAPVVTDKGILLLYNGAMGREKTLAYGRGLNAMYREGHSTYQLGWILMDRNDPEKVIARCEEPVLGPTEPYELYGMVGYTLFASGLVEFRDRYFLYYGLSDSRIGVATADVADGRRTGAVDMPDPRSVTPESLGVSSKGVIDWIDACEKELSSLHGFVLMRHGKVVAEGSWGPYDTLNEPHMLFSHSKSFTSTAIGFLVDDGKVDLDERIVEIFSDKVPANPSENLRQLRVRDLLTMNVGAKHTDAERDDISGDWERAFLANRIDDPPGTVFRYDSGATYMCASIVERKSGMGLMDFLKKRLFDKIGIEKAWSTTSPSGTACGGWGMNMTTRELAKFGQFLLQRGVWNGERLLSDEWIAMASARQTWSGSIAVAGEDGSDWHQGYGFQFWRCKPGCFRADGANGQLTIVMPQHDAVLSVHAGLGDMQRELSLVWKHVLPAFREGPVPENRSAAEALARRCAELKIEPLSGSTVGAEKFCDKLFVFKGSPHRYKTLKMTSSGAGWEATFVTDGGTNSFQVGNGAWKFGRIAVDRGPYEPLGKIVGREPLRVASSGCVGKDGVFRVMIRFLTSPHDLEMTFCEKDGKLVASGVLCGLGGGKLEAEVLDGQDGGLPIAAGAGGVVQ